MKRYFVKGPDPFAGACEPRIPPKGGWPEDYLDKLERKARKKFLKDTAASCLYLLLRPLMWLLLLPVNVSTRIQKRREK